MLKKRIQRRKQIMNSLLDVFPQLPVSQWMTDFIGWITTSLSASFHALNTCGSSLMDITTSLLFLIPPLVCILVVVVAAYVVCGRRYGLSIFAAIGLWYIQSQNLWGNMMYTFTLS